MDDDQIEELMRRGLEARVAGVDDRGGLATAAREVARGRRHVRVAAAGIAAAVVIVPVVVIANQDDNAGPIADRATNPSTSGPASSGGVPDNWRVESYGGVQLRVPPDWGWGASPVDGFDRDPGPMSCGVGAGRAADGTDVRETGGVSYVGRPIYLSDLCVTGLPRMTDAPYVWFDSPVEVGSEQLDHGFSRETVRIGGQNISVADDDATERSTILASVDVVATDSNGCISDASIAVDATEHRGQGLGEIGAVDSVSVCYYWTPYVSQPEVAPPRWTGLEYSMSIHGAGSQALADAIAATPLDRGGRCLLGHFGDLLTLDVHGTTGDAQLNVSLSSCLAGYTGADGFRDLTPDNVSGWAVDGVSVYIYANGLPRAVGQYFAQPVG